MTGTGRIHNFGAGPAVLPLEVVEECQKSLPNLDNSGFGLIEISHRSQTFQNIVDSSMEKLRRILSVPEDYTVLYLQGGASLQFYMSALNLLRENDKADFLVTGVWSQKSLKEANRIGDASAIWDDSENGFKSIPQNGDYSIRHDSLYSKSDLALFLEIAPSKPPFLSIQENTLSKTNIPKVFGVLNNEPLDE